METARDGWRRLSADGAGRALELRSQHSPRVAILPRDGRGRDAAAPPPPPPPPLPPPRRRRRRRRRRRLHTRRRRAGQKRLPRRQRARPACCLRMARFSCLHDRRRRRRLRRLQVCRRCCSQLQTPPPGSRVRGRRGARSRDPGGRPARRCGGRLAMSCVITNTGLINGRGVECHLLNTNQEIVDTKSYMETRRKEASKFGKIF